MLRKMIMKFLAFSVALIFMFFIVLSCDKGVLKVSANDIDQASASPEEMFEIQKNAVQANEKVYASFEWDQTYIYPNNAGFSW